jgi:HlyD family secretion protein
VLGGLALAIVGGAALALRPRPIPVDVVTVVRGALTVTVDESGKTRVQDRYLLSAPVAGRLSRIELRPGDRVTEAQIVARIAPTPPALLDVRSRAEAEARLSAALFSERQARALADRAAAAVDQANRELARLGPLLKAGAVTQRSWDDAQFAARTASEESASARFGVNVAQEEARRARAVLQGDRHGRAGTAAASGDPYEVPVRSPVGGVVLRVAQEHELVVAPGTPLVEVADPARLEIVVDVLSTDAVRIQPGARVGIERWGGERTLAGHVHRVEPQAFTRVSALGVDEQRVNVIVHPEDPHAVWQALGDGYRVEASITVWQGRDVVTAPSSAVFRADDGALAAASDTGSGAERWAVYRVDGRRVAHLVPVTLGHRGAADVEITAGLAGGDDVVRYPSDRLADGKRVDPRGR